MISITFDTFGVGSTPLFKVLKIIEDVDPGFTLYHPSSHLPGSHVPSNTAMLKRKNVSKEKTIFRSVLFVLV